jgi:signal transduction histidine kinase
MRSLENQLRLSLSTLLIAVLAAWLLGGEWALRQIAEQFVAARLAHDARAVAAAVASPAGDAERATLPPIYHQPFSGHYFQVQPADGGVQRSRSLWDSSLEVPALAPGEHQSTSGQGPRQQPLLLWCEGFSHDQGDFTVAIAEDMTPLNAALTRFHLIGFALSLAVVALLLAVQRRLLRRAFRRLDPVRSQIQRIALGAEGHLPEQVPQEVQPLVAAINHLLDAWREHLQRSRNSLGNLAHALKGPLHRLLRETDDEDRRAQLTRMSTLIERELTRARVAGRGTPGQWFRPQADVADLLEAMTKLYPERGLRMRQRVEAPEHLPFEREDLLELLGNLIENATKWAREEIRVDLSYGPPLELSVEDDGPGVDPSHLHDLPERGLRLGEAAPGHGLGLGIVHDIARLYGGSVEFDRSPSLGGLRVRVSCPGAADPLVF